MHGYDRRPPTCRLRKSRPRAVEGWLSLHSKRRECERWNRPSAQPSENCGHPAAINADGDSQLEASSETPLSGRVPAPGEQACLLSMAVTRVFWAAAVAVACGVTVCVRRDLR